MNLKTFTAQNTETTRYSLPKMSVNPRAGIFLFNRTACEQLTISEGDLIAIHQDQDEPTNWYIEKVRSGGFMLRQRVSSGRELVFNNSTLARSITDSLLGKRKSVRYLIAGEPTKIDRRLLWGLLICHVE